MAGRRALVYGGKGALGSVVVSHFKSKGWWVASIDLFANEEAAANVVLQKTESWTEQGRELGEKAGALLGEDKVDAIICVAGGWAGGSAASAGFVGSCDLMWKQSVWTSVLAAQLASNHLKNGGLLLLTGAKAALSGTAGMIGYGLAKAAVHQLVSSLADSSSGLPPDSSALAILPITLDTPANRKGMPDADHSQWTPLDVVAEQLLEWSEGRGRPSSASLVEVVTVDGVTSFTAVPR